MINQIHVQLQIAFVRGILRAEIIIVVSSAGGVEAVVLILALEKLERIPLAASSSEYFLDDRVEYEMEILAPRLKMAWEGLHGVTSHRVESLVAALGSPPGV